VTVSIRSNQTYPVTTISGQTLELQHKSEQKFYSDAQKKYRTENKFDVASDLRALDRLIFLETLMHRWTSWLASGQDYDGYITPQHEEQVRKNIKETGPLISTIQNDLGLTKSQREKDQFESVGAYIVKLQQAAKAHGIRREKQLTRSLDLINQLFSMVGSYRRSTDSEKKKLGIENADQILEWIDVHMRAEYDEVDEYFREHEQKAWVGTL
jgi:hypothetical protein